MAEGVNDKSFKMYVGMPLEDLVGDENSRRAEAP